MEKVSNPWTNKTRVRGQGKLNSIMDKYFGEEQQALEHYTKMKCKSQQVKKQHKFIIKKMNQLHQPVNKIGEHEFLFKLRQKINKIDEILEWIRKIQERDYSKQNESDSIATSPLSSNFIYLPLYGGTIFCEILKQCTVKDKQKSIGEYKNQRLKKSLQQIKSIDSMHENLQQQIIN